ncbi:alcohol dehydrogenase GroES domain protein [Dunaliella salina]|uniref:Alcohol dehydrogenase GroES domain protein n=1 Tax=Dunaliella salina TaxID=3046 RepID=A0ABQ7G085_DUNSA|nr:alcohol dehydrogenase GroES domain protein [Dunaliella salina]|eukprot:KAF5828016.1 alcohol dehydrogenase GroES domain protein [Dunaliella salina]
MGVPDKVTAMASLEPKKPLQKWEHTPQPLGPQDIDIHVTHNGLCHTDLHMVDNDWGVAKFPFVPGHEVVGTVAAKGSQVTEFEVGERVGYAWINGSCGACGHCIGGDENICLKGWTGTIVGGNHGGFQTYMRQPAKFAYKIPEGLDSVAAAPLLCAGITVYSPLRRLVTHPGTKVTVVGIGGLGHLAIQFAAKMGAEVTALSTSANKEAEAKGFGAKNFVVSSDPNQMKAMAGTQEVIINTVSSANDYAAQMALLRPNGSLCIVGAPVTDVKVGVSDLVFAQKKLMGSLVGGRRDMNEMLEFAAQAGVAPKCETMPLSKVNEAFEKVKNNQARYRIVLLTDV